MCELQALDGGLALFRNVADDVRDGVRLVLEMTVRHVDERLRRDAPARQSEVLDEPGVVLVHIHATFCKTTDVSITSRQRETKKRRTLSSSSHHRVLLGSEPSLDLGGELLGRRQRLDEVLHVVVLARDEAAQVQHDAAGLVALPRDRHVGVLQRVELLAVPLALALQLLGDLLLQDQRLEGVVALLLRAGQADREPRGVVLLLVEETRQAAVLALVPFDLDLEILRLLGERVGKRLEFEELHCLVSNGQAHHHRPEIVKLTCCLQLSTSSMR